MRHRCEGSCGRVPVVSYMSKFYEARGSCSVMTVHVVITSNG